MFPNAELALMFIPVPIKAKYFVPGLVLVDLYLGISGKSIFGGGGIAHFAHVGGALFDLLLCGIGRKSVQSKPMELK
jgi:membrane associated rhomboid family serine protease